MRLDLAGSNIEYINITSRGEFELLLHFLGIAKTVVADTETNGLKYYRQHYIISMSFYFPEFGIAFNLPIRHGEGSIDIPYTDNAPATMPFNEMSWQGKTKGALYLRHWWEKIKPSIDFGNMPVEWLDEVKKAWGKKGVTYVFHNARFDLHMLNQEGFPVPDIVEDTMLALHVVNEDWSGIEVLAPYKENGVWARNEDGTFKKKMQYGNRQLKWQAMMWELPFADVGEDELHHAKLEFEGVIADYIMANLDDPYNDGLRYVRANDKQRERILKKIDIDSKANMWMLPADKVAQYAMLDTVLTWDLRQRLMPIIKRWNNEDLYENMCAIQLEVAWRMEVNGLQLDLDEARRQIALYEPRIREIEGIANEIAAAMSEQLGYTDSTCSVCEGKGYTQKNLEYDPYDENGMSANKILELNAVHHPCVKCGETGTVREYVLEPTVVLGSATKLLPFIRAAVSVTFDDVREVIPEWVSGEVVAQMDNKAFRIKKGQLESTAKEALEPFSSHPIVWLVLEYRKLKKTVDTYLKNWINARDPFNIVHGNMNSDGTVAGRFSSSGDGGNYQNIPERNGYTIKMAFIARPNTIKIAIDYGQLEARVAAYIAEILLPSMGVYKLERPLMTELFNSGEDMHLYTMNMINLREVVFGSMTDIEIAIKLGIDTNKYSGAELLEYLVKKVFRQMAKTLNFGLLYSGTYVMIMKLLRVEEAVARELERKWKALFPAFALAQAYFQRQGQTWRAMPDGSGKAMYSTQPMTGRHRKMHLYPTTKSFLDPETGTWKTFNPRMAEAKKIWNNIVQGWSGWMSVQAAMLFGREHGWDGMYLYAQIHDALDADVEYDKLWKVKELIKFMEAYDINPKLTTDLEAGYNWQPADRDNPNGMQKVKDIDLWIASQGIEYGAVTEERKDGTFSWRRTLGRGEYEWVHGYTDAKAAKAAYYAEIEGKYAA